MAITAAMVKELRETRGAGMMDCKKALTATDGDKEKAIDWQTIDDLKGLKVGATTGYFYGEAFAHAEKAGEITVIRASSEPMPSRPWPGAPG